jgi:hypothetical protein
VPATTVALALPYVNWVVLVALAVGSFAFAAIAGATTEATRGYLRFTAICSGILAALALASDYALPTPTSLAIATAPTDLDGLRRVTLGAFALLSVVYAFTLGRPRRRLLFGSVALGTGAAALIVAAAGWAPTLVDAVPFAVQLVTLSAVTGGSLAGIVLGHWYLVTPKLSETALVQQTRLLLAAIAIQALLYVVWATLGGGVDQGPWEALSGPAALLVWLRGGITIVFPLVLTYMALRTAQTRSMESATGLLYINLAAVLAGTIGAAALYVSTGILI